MRNIILFSLFMIVLFICMAALSAKSAVQAPEATPAAIQASMAASVAAGPKSKWEIGSITLHRDDGKGEPGEKTEYFHPEDHAHHVVIRFKSLQLGILKPQIRFISLNTAESQNNVIAESASDAAIIGNEFKGSLSLEKDFPVGYYRFEFDINGEPAAAGNYCVMEKPEKFKIYEYSLHLPDKDGRIGEEVKAFKTRHLHMYLNVRSSGLKPGTQLKWVWRALKTDIGSGEVTSAGGRITDVGVFNLRPDLTVAHPLPPGSYCLEMHLDGKPVASFPFTIE